MFDGDIMRCSSEPGCDGESGDAWGLVDLSWLKLQVFPASAPAIKILVKYEVLL